MSATQLPLPGLPFEPRQLARLSSIERSQLYAALGLDQFQRQAAEEAARAAIAKRYRRVAR